MAGVERRLNADVDARVVRAGRGGGFEPEGSPAVVEEAEHGGRAVALAEPTPESGAGDDAEPVLANGGGPDEDRGVVRRAADEDLLDEVVH